MPGGLGPRFFLEAAFLLLLAVGTGLAHLSTRTIVIVMAVAWALVAAIEWIAWRERARYLDQGPYAWRADGLAWPEERQVDPYAQIVVPPPPPEPELQARSEDLTVVVPPQEAGRRRWLGLRRARPEAEVAVAEPEAAGENGAAE
jgi:hypothetical protein